MFEGANFTPLIVGVIALIVGWALGFGDSNNRAKSKIQQAEQRAENAIREAKAVAERAAAAQANIQVSTPASTGTTLLRLSQDSERRPQLEMDGGSVDTMSISEPTRKRLIALITLMRPWVEGKASMTIDIPAPMPSSISASIPVPVSASVVPVQPVTIMSALGTLGAKKDKPAAPLSMVQQIDEVLQARLASGPLAGRGIKLTESPDGGVTVIVGAQKFQGVGEVPDAEIQSAIRAAIAEWETKYG